jgi:hypothetical protein
MKKIILGCVILVLGLCCGTDVFAGGYSFSDWRISQEGEVKDWPESLESTHAHSENWIDETEWELNRARRFRNKSAEVYAVCEITAETDYRLGLSLTGDVEVRLNGSVLERYKANNIFELNLKRGKNLFEIKLPQLKPKKKHNSVLLSEVELDYLFPPVDQKIKAARRAIEALGKKHPQYKSAAYLRAPMRMLSSCAIRRWC